MPGVDEVVAGRDEVMVHADDGAAAMSPVALALHGAGATVVSLTLRTPTLDDVFLQLTGSHLQADEPTRPTAPGRRPPSDPTADGRRHEAVDDRRRRGGSTRDHGDRPTDGVAGPGPPGRLLRRPGLGGPTRHPPDPAGARASVVPALIVPIFFYVLNIGALSKVTGAAAHIDFKSFELPVAVVFAVTGVSRASSLVTDIQNGYFDRLMITPVRRLPLLLGLMMADLALVMALAVPVAARRPRPSGSTSATGVPGMVLFVVLSGIWGLVFTGLPYAIALKTGNPGAVNASFVLFFPITFLSTTFVPKAALEGWLRDGGHLQPDDLHPGRAPGARLAALERRPPSPPWATPSWPWRPSGWSRSPWPSWPCGAGSAGPEAANWPPTPRARPPPKSWPTKFH